MSAAAAPEGARRERAVHQAQPGQDGEVEAPTDQDAAHLELRELAVLDAVRQHLADREPSHLQLDGAPLLEGRGCVMHQGQVNAGERAWWPTPGETAKKAGPYRLRGQSAGQWFGPQ